MNIKNLSFLIMLLLPFVATAKLDSTTRNRLMQEAETAFHNADYEEAGDKYLFVFVKDGDEKSHSLYQKCEDCLDMIKQATALDRDGHYKDAITKYQAVLSMNPADKNIPKLIAECKRRLYMPKLQLARQNYREGKYMEARNYLSEYTSLSGMTDTELLTAITEGITWSNEAKTAYYRKEYEAAKSYYEKILAVNPTDAVSLKAMSEINQLIHDKNIVAQEKRQSAKVSLKPIKNRFNFFIYSGFASPVAIGGGIGFNLSYFQLSIDGGGSGYRNSIKDGKIYAKDINSFKKLKNGNYAQGKFQLAVSPGVNLKYLGINVGLGSLMTKELTNLKTFNPTYDNYYYGEEVSKSYFLIRPTIEGFIPFDKDFSAGLKAMFGYNIISGASEFNQIIIGIGMFF